MCSPTIYDLLPNTISLQVSADGHLLLRWPAGRITAPSGPALARVNLSARQAKAKGLLTSGTCGPHGTGSLISASLQLSLESKLRARMALDGLTLYRLTWRHRGMPSGRQIFALRGSVRPTSEIAYGSWPTPTLPHGGRVLTEQQFVTGKRHNGQKVQVGMESAARFVGWPTPSVRDHKGGYQGGRMRDGKWAANVMDQTAQLVGWATPTVSDARRGVNPPRAHDTGIPLTQQVGMLAISGPTSNGSLSKMPSGGQLNPALSRWVMGYPPEWCACAVTAMQSFLKPGPNSSKQRG